MTTYISLASSATMFPVGSPILTSPLTPQLVKERLANVAVISALNNDHSATIDAISRRYDLALPLSQPGPDGRAPQVKLAPGDELFIVQASLPRLKEGERHADEIVANAPISFLRWRVPVTVNVPAPAGIPQIVFAQIIDHAHSIALWERGEDHLKSVEKLQSDLTGELNEFEDALKAEDESQIETTADLLLEAADVLYKQCCIAFVTGDEQAKKDAFFAYHHALHRAHLSSTMAEDAALLKYGRRARGAKKDEGIERDLVIPILTAFKARS